MSRGLSEANPREAGLRTLVVVPYGSYGRHDGSVWHGYTKPNSASNHGYRHPSTNGYPNSNAVNFNARADTHSNPSNCVHTKLYAHTDTRSNCNPNFYPYTYGDSHTLLSDNR